MVKSYLSLAPSFYLHGKLESFRISAALTPSDWLQVEAMKFHWSRMDDACNCKALGNVWIPVKDFNPTKMRYHLQSGFYRRLPQI